MRFISVLSKSGEWHNENYINSMASFPLTHYSEEMAWLMDQEIQKLIIDAESKATEILSGKRHALDALAEALMKEETLERADVERITQGSKEGDRHKHENLD